MDSTWYALGTPRQHRQMSFMVVGYPLLLIVGVTTVVLSQNNKNKVTFLIVVVV
jgi:hypothetical protein